MGFFTAAAATATAAAGTYMQGQAASDQAKAQAAQGRRNADVAERDAVATDIKTRFDQVRDVQRGERAVGKVRAKLGTSGAIISDDAPQRIVAEQIMENELQNAMIGYSGATQASRLRSQAAGLRSGADIADIRADSLKTATLLNTGSSLLGNVGAMFDSGMFTSGTESIKASRSPVARV